MKVAIPATGEDLAASVEQRFGRCPTFLFVDTETMDWRAVRNEAADQSGGAGVAAAQQVVDEGAEVVLAGEVGLNASDILRNAEIRVYGRVTGKVKDALETLRSGALERTSEVTGPAQKGSARGSRTRIGQGRGAGRGRGRGHGRGGGRGRGRGYRRGNP
jgi:predicted Fe-Mo cluster-binding NifX family protein